MSAFQSCPYPGKAQPYHPRYGRGATHRPLRATASAWQPSSLRRFCACPEESASPAKLHLETLPRRRLTVFFSFEVRLTVNYQHTAGAAGMWAPLDALAYFGDVSGTVRLLRRPLSALGVGEILQRLRHRINGPYRRLGRRGFPSSSMEESSLVVIAVTSTDGRVLENPTGSRGTCRGGAACPSVSREA